MLRVRIWEAHGVGAVTCGKHVRVREADLGGWISKFFSGDAEDKVTRPVESVSTNEGLKGTNLRRIDTTSWVSKIDLVLQIEINFFFRLRNIVLEIYILVVYFLR